MVYLSIGLRFIANVEALNMVESVGNVTRHRRAPVVIKTEKGYKIVYVPALSGEAIAHAYQENLVREAIKIYGGKPPVCEWCLRGEFFKEMDNAHTMAPALAVKRAITKGKRMQTSDIQVLKYKFEKAVIQNCLVEDIGGFLHAERDLPVRRTSLFYVGYAVPVLDYISATAIEAQFHARHAPSEIAGEERRKQGKSWGLWENEEEKTKEEERRKQKESVSERRAAQMIYYIETATAIYGLTFNIDLEAIGRTSMYKVEDILDVDEKLRRAKVALAAIMTTLCSGEFGAKRTRFKPITKTISVIGTITDQPFTISSPVLGNYIKDTLTRLEKVEEFYQNLDLEFDRKALVYTTETKVTPSKSVNVFDSPESLFNALTQLSLKKLAQKIGK